jgi:hypothetical protein
VADREINSLDAAVVLLDEWIAAYDELRRDHARLMHNYAVTKEALKHARFAIECDLAEIEENPFA